MIRRSVYLFLGSMILGSAWLSPAWGASYTFTTIDVPGSSTTQALGSTMPARLWASSRMPVASMALC